MVVLEISPLKSKLIKYGILLNQWSESLLNKRCLVYEEDSSLYSQILKKAWGALWSSIDA